MAFGGVASSAEKLIAQVRDLLDEIGLPYIIENVLGASSWMRPHAIILRGQEFGLQVDRGRFCEPGGGLELRLCEALASGGEHRLQFTIDCVAVGYRVQQRCGQRAGPFSIAGGCRF